MPNVALDRVSPIHGSTNDYAPYTKLGDKIVGELNLSVTIIRESNGTQCPLNNQRDRGCPHRHGHKYRAIIRDTTGQRSPFSFTLWDNLDQQGDHYFKPNNYVVLRILGLCEREDRGGYKGHLAAYGIRDDEHTRKVFRMITNFRQAIRDWFSPEELRRIGEVG